MFFEARLRAAAVRYMSVNPGFRVKARLVQDVDVRSLVSSLSQQARKAGPSVVRARLNDAKATPRLTATDERSRLTDLADRHARS
jgi:hypothetical protein